LTPCKASDAEPAAEGARAERVEKEDPADRKAGEEVVKGGARISRFASGLRECGASHNDRLGLSSSRRAAHHLHRAYPFSGLEPS
jgi:hypothetical protein